jgi:hypothetical protein
MIDIFRMHHLLLFLSVAGEYEKGLARKTAKGEKSGSDESVRWPLMNQTSRETKVNLESYIFGFSMS